MGIIWAVDQSLTNWPISLQRCGNLRKSVLDGLGSICSASTNISSTPTSLFFGAFIFACCTSVSNSGLASHLCIGGHQTSLPSAASDFLKLFGCSFWNFGCTMCSVLCFPGCCTASLYLLVLLPLVKLWMPSFFFLFWLLPSILSDFPARYKRFFALDRLSVALLGKVSIALLQAGPG